MKRRPDWLPRLTALIEQHETTPYAYGRQDCGLWAAAAVKAQTGVDPARGLRGYRTARGSLRMLARHGVRSVADLATVKLGAPIAPLAAKRGDIVTDGTALGVMWTRGGLFVADDGLVEYDRHLITAAWAIGDE